MFAKFKTAAIGATLAAAIAAVPAAPAMALDKKDQAFLKGVLATLAVGALVQSSRQNHNKVYRAPNYLTTPTYRQPNYYRAPTYYGAPVYRQPNYTYVNPNRSAYIPSVPQSTYVTPARSAFLNYSPTMRRAIQARLADYGYYNGSIDGVWGPRTDAAIRAYANDSGLGNRLGSYSGAVQVLDNLAA